MSHSPFHHSVAASSQPHRAAAFRSPVAVSNAPPGTFAPGTKVQVGNHRVVIEKYLSEGGFAHVYLVRVPSKDGGKTEVAVLKRVAVPDKDALANMRTEVETMKKLKGHRHIVTYIDSHASQLKGGGYEVFLLMEYCQGGGLIDFMNTRLQHRLTEPEILKIFSDVAEGVACMHYLKPPLLHRDLKVENVLISHSGSSRIYKLCDFGSTAPPRPAAATAAEGRLIEDDVQRHTTLQYRSPEMIDVYRKLPIDEKSDIWALGVLLYKLCYYTTPFEDQGQMAILNATFKFPHYPAFSERLKRLISSMLRESPRHRPNIYQAVSEVCSIRNTPVPIKDIYATRSQSETRRNEQLPSPEPSVSSPPVIGIQKAAPVKQVQQIPDIVPMRRGRPTAPGKQTPVAQPSPSPMRGAGGDPFAALDSSSASARNAAADELSARFPSLDEFSLLHDRGGKFQFTPSAPVEPKQDDLSKRVTQALADEAFALPAKSRSETISNAQTPAMVSRTTSVKKPRQAEPAKEPTSKSQPALIHQPTPQRPQMVSTGTMTSPSPSPTGRRYPERNPEEKPVEKFSDISSRPIFRFPSSKSGHQRALSQPRVADNPRSSAPSLETKPSSSFLSRPGLLDLGRSRSSSNALAIPKSPASSRPSLEGSRPSALDLGDPLGRSKSANARPRPSSVSVHVESSLDYLRDREISQGRKSTSLLPQGEFRRRPSNVVDDIDSEPEDNKNIFSNVDFLRVMEGDDSSKKDKRRSSSGASKHSKRTSLPSISLSNTKKIVAGKFGDAFRRFETNTPSEQPPRTPSPIYDRAGGTALTPIAGSEATGGTSDNENAIDETQDLPPEVRRELERRRLSQEEKRVAEAQAEYRKRLAERGDSGRGSQGAPGPSRASTIQNKVKTLLEDNSSPVTRTAEGYGRFTETKGPPQPPRPYEQTRPSYDGPRPMPSTLARKPVPGTAKPLPAGPSAGPSYTAISRPLQNPAGLPPASAPPPTTRSSSRPNAPPKPIALRTGGSVKSQFEPPPPSPKKSTLQGKPLPTAPGPDSDVLNGTPEDWEAQFSKRYPSLSGLEMVEAEIGVGRSSGGLGIRTKDV